MGVEALYKTQGNSHASYYQSCYQTQSWLLNLAEELSNVSKACKIMGVSRDTFYRYRELTDEGGVDALINRSRRTPNLKNRTNDATEQAVVDYAVAFPAHGQHRTSNDLRKQGVLSPEAAFVQSDCVTTLRTSKNV